jgi:transcriptional regulator with XRE-family HTH domain
MPHTDSIILQALGCTINFSRLITDCREKSGLSPQDFASKLDISKQKLSNIELGKARTLPKEAAEYARILNESEEQFVRLALQDMFDKDGLNYNIVLKSK